MNKLNKKIVFENGREFYGTGFGADRDKIAEAVFNTSVVGYQELMSDPTYYGQMVVMTYPIIGSYGITDEDFESKAPNMGGLIVGDYNDKPSNYRYTRTLADVMSEYGIPGITGLDTRTVSKMIRDEGSMKVLLTDAETPHEEAMARLAEWDIRHDHVLAVSCKKMWHKRTPNYTYNVVAIDCGIKNSIIKQFNRVGCNVTVVPPFTTAQEIMDLEPDGVFISNGPGSPLDVPEIVKTVKALYGRVPMFGIALGHQLICLSQGASVDKMKHGHRGGYPVRVLKNGKVEVTSQNHSYYIVRESLEGTGLAVTHENVIDKLVAGVEDKDNFVMAVQFNPEGAPGSQDTEYIFEEFNQIMKEFRMRGDK